MATIITEMPTQTRAGRTPKYPWGEWFDGQVRLLTQGEDFDCTTGSLRANAYKTARDHAKKISVVTVDEVTLALQATPTV